MSSNNIHDASAQFLGYHYQSLLGLYLLFEQEDGHSICIEKADDVSIHDDLGKAEMLVQSKFHSLSKGSLINTSVDLWRTIKSWSDFLLQNPKAVDSTLFLLMTNSSILPNTVASCLGQNASNKSSAWSTLFSIASSKLPEGNQKFYQSFLQLDPETRTKMVNSMTICGDSPKISDILKKIKGTIRYAAFQKDVDSLTDQVIGWWEQRVTECLLSTAPQLIPHEDLANFIVNASHNYQEQELPLTINLSESVTKDELNKAVQDSHNFFGQLALIQASEQRIQLSMDDFCHAFEQRSSWVRKGLKNIEKLNKYDEDLVYEWKHLFAQMQEDLNQGSAVPSEEEKIKQGLLLLKSVENLSISIDPSRSEPFLMRGSYQMLANSLRVGWHVDFHERLK